MALRFEARDRNRIARSMWEADGEPDSHEPGEVNLRSYESEVHRVVQAIYDAGWTISRDTPRETA